MSHACHELATSIKGLALIQFPFNIEEPDTQESSSGKEQPGDRQRSAQALMALHPLPEVGFLTINNDATIRPRTRGSKAIRGDLDLLLGTSDHISVVRIFVDKPVIAETKAVNTSLCARRVRKRKEAWDLLEVSQTVLELIIVGQIQKEPVAAFLMTRNRVRPFLYFPQQDVMLTTQRAYAWKYENRIGLRGCMFISVILREDWK